MQSNFDYLPYNKQSELSTIVTIINEAIPAEMVILFGSYARNDWVEAKYGNGQYRYQSDFDILVVVETKSESAHAKFERDIEDGVEQNASIKTPVSFIVHDIDFVNRRLSKAQYFFTDIKKEGVVLYDSGKFQLKEARELLPAERKKLAQEDFDYWFNSAKKFYETFLFNFEKGKDYYPNAAFELHQVTERLYSSILLVFTRYKPNTHDLLILRKLTNSVDNRLLKIFPLDNIENCHLFKLLRKAYIDARYKPSYTITQDELSQLSNKVKELKEIGEQVCAEKIDSFTSR